MTDNYHLKFARLLRDAAVKNPGNEDVREAVCAAKNDLAEDLAKTFRQRNPLRRELRASDFALLTARRVSEDRYKTTMRRMVRHRVEALRAMRKIEL